MAKVESRFWYTLTLAVVFLLGLVIGHNQALRSLADDVQAVRFELLHPIDKVARAIRNRAW